MYSLVVNIKETLINHFLDFLSIQISTAIIIEIIEHFGHLFFEVVRIQHVFGHKLYKLIDFDDS